MSQSDICLHDLRKIRHNPSGVAVDSARTGAPSEEAQFQGLLAFFNTVGGINSSALLILIINNYKFSLPELFSPLYYVILNSIDLTGHLK